MNNFRVYNGEAKNKATKVFGGESSGIRDWDDIQYPIMLDYNKELFGEYWIEDEIKLGKDIEDYREKMTSRERYVYNVLTGKLNWLDSIATDFNFVLGYLCTDSSVRSIISLIASFEQLHNRSYQYLTSTILNHQEKVQAFNEVRELEALTYRNEHIIKPIQDGIDQANKKLSGEPLDNDTLNAILKGILGNIILEGLYFSGAFVYFNSLARDQKMMGSNNLINMIKTDENMHSKFYGLLIQIIMLENPELNTEENKKYFISYIKEAVKREKEWGHFIFEGIDTLSIKEYYNYVEYLANIICRNIGLEDLYEDNTELKSKWISTYGSKKRDGADQIVTRTDFLQSDAINYAHEGGEDFDL